MYMDRNDVPLLWYIDLIDGIGVDADGIPLYNDMFLDLLVSDSGQVVEDDRDEFQKIKDGYRSIAVTLQRVIEIVLL